MRNTAFNFFLLGALTYIGYNVAASVASGIVKRMDATA